jgi:hypothetical protein
MTQQARRQVCSRQAQAWPRARTAALGQVTLLPAMTPAWAKTAYSVLAKPVKVDALEYLPRAMEHALEELKVSRHVCHV